MSKRTTDPDTSLCPICRQPAAPAYAPFCSAGCRDRDLLQWLGEGYRIPVQSSETDADERPESSLG